MVRKKGSNAEKGASGEEKADYERTVVGYKKRGGKRAKWGPLELKQKNLTGLHEKGKKSTGEKGMGSQPHPNKGVKGKRGRVASFRHTRSTKRMKRRGTQAKKTNSRKGEKGVEQKDSSKPNGNKKWTYDSSED